MHVPRSLQCCQRILLLVYAAQLPGGLLNGRDPLGIPLMVVLTNDPCSLRAYTVRFTVSSPSFYISFIMSPVFGNVRSAPSYSFFYAVLQSFECRNASH